MDGIFGIIVITCRITGVIKNSLYIHVNIVIKFVFNMENKKLLFSITMKYLEMQTFSVGGHGGGGKDTSNSGVRLIHKASGAVGEGRDHRSNTRNRQDALVRLAATKEFKLWHKAECARQMGKKVPETVEEIYARVDDAITEGILKGYIQVEYYDRKSI